MNNLKVTMETIGRAILREFVYGGHLLSIGASGIVFTVVLLMNLQVSWVILVIPYLISQVVYTYDHFAGINSTDNGSNPERTAHLRKQKDWIEVILLGYALVLAGLLLLTNFPTALVTLCIVLGGIAYTVAFKAVPITGFKSLYVAFFWALLVLMVPMFYHVPITFSVIGIFVFVFLRWIVNTAFFDIKDIESDRHDRIRTFAAVWGRNKTIYLLHIINFLSLIPISILFYTDNFLGGFVYVIVLFLYDFYYLMLALMLNEKKLRILSYFVVDGEYIVWPILVLICKFLF